MGSISEEGKINYFDRVNKNLHGFEDDFFYHLSLGKNRDNLIKMFGDVKVSNLFLFSFYFYKVIALTTQSNKSYSDLN